MFMSMLLSQTLSVHMCDDIGSQVKGPQRAAHMLCIRYKCQVTNMGGFLLLAVRSLPQALLVRISGRSHGRRSVRGLAVEEGLPASACMRSCFRIFHGNALSLCIDVMQLIRDREWFVDVFGHGFHFTWEMCY